MIVNRYNFKWETDIVEDGILLYFLGQIAPLLKKVWRMLNMKSMKNG